MPEVWGVQQGPAGVVPNARALLPVPAVHVPPAEVPVLAGLQQQPGRDNLLQVCFSLARVHGDDLLRRNVDQTSLSLVLVVCVCVCVCVCLSL